VSQKEWLGFERKYMENSKDIQEIKITKLALILLTWRIW
jgi:hypothetical protein